MDPRHMGEDDGLGKVPNDGNPWTQRGLSLVFIYDHLPIR